MVYEHTLIYTEIDPMYTTDLLLRDSSVRFIWLVFSECYKGSLNTKSLVESFLPFLVSCNRGDEEPSLPHIEVL